VLSRFADLELHIPEGWGDISADLPPNYPPTLARGAGVGALQFSVARYRSGAKPAIDEEGLKRLLVGFFQTHSFGQVEPSVLSTSKMLCVGGVSIISEEVMAVWYLSNGIDVVLVTYTGLGPNAPTTKEELSEARTIVESIEF
jgi:hypothetical protein